MALRARLTVVAAAGTLLATQVLSGLAQLLSGALAAGVPLVCRREVRGWFARPGAARRPATPSRAAARRHPRRCRTHPAPPRRRPVLEWCAPSAPGWGRPDSRSGRA